MANYTLAPEPWQTFFYADGSPVAAGQLYTYLAGTTTPATTYSTSSGTTNTNPIILDAAGRCAIYLSPGSYRFDLFDSVAAGGALIRSQDNISSVPTGSSDTDIDGIAGTTITAGQVCYLSDGSGALTAGRWYPAKADNTYSSTTPEVAFAVNDVATGITGSFRLIGRITSGLSVTVGLLYYISAATAGAVTATAPANARFVGMADSGTSMVVSPNPPSTAVTAANAICQGRLTLTTAVPVTTADVTSATTIRYAPYAGNQIALYNGTNWAVFTFPELSIAVPATTSQMYDVFIFDNSGTRTMELLAWTNDTTRATALVTQDGILCKTGALTRRYVGSFRTTTVSGQTEDSAVKRYVWNYYNRVRRPMKRVESTATWTYTTATVRQANAAAANQLDIVVGFAEVTMNVWLQAAANSGSASVGFWVGIGEDSTSAVSANSVGGGGQSNAGDTNATCFLTAELHVYPAVGRHIYPWQEWSVATGTTTWAGTPAGALSVTGSANGLTGWIEG